MTIWKTEDSPHQDGMKSPPREGSSPGAAQVLTMAHVAHQDYPIFFGENADSPKLYQVFVVFYLWTCLLELLLWEYPDLVRRMVV